jgi:SMC interacting uncharacterized protein involved in chromosome segregation
MTDQHEEAIKQLQDETNNLHEQLKLKDVSYSEVLN